MPRPQFIVLAVVVALYLPSCFSQAPNGYLPPKNAIFGRNMLQYFAMAPGYKNFNHGSAGTVPKYVLAAQQGYILQAEARPDKWFRGDYDIYVDNAREKVAQYVNAETEDVVLVENASTGVNAVLRSLKFAKGDRVLHTNIAYPMVTYTLDYLVEREGIESVNMALVFPASDADILSHTEELLKKGGFRLAVFSHITAYPSVILPIKKLAALCHKYNVPVLVDGAHALGQIKIDVKDLGVEYYVATGYKWLYSPKSSGFLWARRDVQSNLVPTVISSSGDRDFVGAFQFTGARDYTGFCAMTDAFEFRNALGEERMSEYIHNLAVTAGYKLAEMWGTEVFTNDNSTFQAMVTIGLPTNDSNIARAIQQRLLDDYDTMAVFYRFQGALWARLSAQIYLELQDFIDLGKLILELIKESTTM